MSSLDANTEDHIFHTLLGPSVILKARESVLLLSTSAVKYLQLSDYTVALEGDSTLVEQGRFHHLIANRQYVFGLRLGDNVYGLSNPTLVAHSKFKTEIQIQTKSLADNTERKDASLAEPQDNSSSYTTAEICPDSIYTPSFLSPETGTITNFLSQDTILIDGQLPIHPYRTGLL
ncbi:hypothetical protein N7495_007489 [Penicillium taxi]|uniref:uncharacterized protein n=1 Tax=Penicillium taxi TaxID=168475 RepID=UPI00254576D8|nr:uncharacterized protein N7495_007489 [Penicillium taxi]KAJ5887448.1 hypothetical protein N7495_007489 [Penicillium taxi]